MKFQNITNWTSYPNWIKPLLTFCEPGVKKSMAGLHGLFNSLHHLLIVKPATHQPKDVYQRSAPV
jgi:hypothetical protein